MLYSTNFALAEVQGRSEAIRAGENEKSIKTIRSRLFHRDGLKSHLNFKQCKPAIRKPMEQMPERF